MPMKIIAITGGIGSGKSTFLRTLRGLNQCVESADEICKHITSDHQELQTIGPELVREFGKDIIIEGWGIDKKRLSSIVFDSKEKRLALENIIIPRMNEIFEERKEQHKDRDVIFYEVPTLFENKLENKFDKIILVTAPKEKRIKRVIERQKYTDQPITEQEVIKRMDAQMPECEKILKCDYVYHNNIDNNEDYMKKWIEENLGIKEDKFSATFNFSSLSSREAFVSWLCNNGEQSYWNWCESNDDSVVQFDYWGNGKPFMHLHDQADTFAASLSDKEIFISTKETV